MRQFKIGARLVGEDDEDFQRLLSEARRTMARPSCLCMPQGVPMYVASLGEQFLVKRMPLTGTEHGAGCPSYEPPYELSGLGQLVGRAIRLDADAGVAALRLGFALSKRTTPKASPDGAGEDSTVTSESRKLSLRGLLHFLWHESGLTEWTSNWNGKRHWWHVQRHLAAAAGTMSTRGESLADRLFVPEPFRAEEKGLIEQRRASALAELYSASSGAKRLMILLGEVKEFAPARDGRQIVVKQMPGFRLHLEEVAWRRLQKTFATEIALWQASEATHLMAITTISGTPSGMTRVEEIALMTVTEQWLPVEDAYEERLIETLAWRREKIVKGLRYDLPRGRPIANAIMSEHRPNAIALYIVPPDANDEFELVLQEMIDARPDIGARIWRVGDGDVPIL